ncbi:sporulation protein YpjB [Virgibacillus alimentarius]|uniref:sporulation protein YpjB n=1 Tax=Virgibacillus alimentarius TaxID=698769 RepID=UPI001CF7B34A|nr:MULTISPECIES: sporulation protein YpjB [Virgibacillus]
MKIVKTQIQLLVIILVGIIIYFITNINPIEAAEQPPPEPATAPKKDSEMIPFYWMIIIVGGCIAFTLSYVSWRKYKGEEKKEKDSNS